MNRSIWAILSLLVAVAATARGQLDWDALQIHQQTISSNTFSRLVREVYSPDGGLAPYLRFGPRDVSLYATPAHTGTPLFTLQFAAEDKPLPEKNIGGDSGPLTGLRIAIDPGHIGGAWARIEERYFWVDRQRDWPVQEAALNLYVARLLRDQLEAAGADVILVKDDFEPMSTVLPDQLLKEASPLPPADSRHHHLPELFIEASRLDAQRKTVERQFYRTAEIAARAKRINEEIKPDLTLCIHFNATGWGDEKTLYDDNGLAFFIHGNYEKAELAQWEQKYYLFSKLLERSHEQELELAAHIADQFIKATGLPPAYAPLPGGVMHAVPAHPYLYLRNLAANRQYRGPVVFLEPYFMNNRTVYARIQAGDYDGVRLMYGTKYRSIFREYADAVATAVKAYYTGHLTPKTQP